jgi:hypothetical protein
LGLACALAAKAHAQSAPSPGDAPVEAGAQLLSIVGLAAAPDITASRLEPEGSGQLPDQRIDTLRLGNEISIPFRDGSLYFEGNVGFALAEVDLRVGDGVAEANNFYAVGAFGSVGPDFTVARHLQVRPLLIVGAGYVDDDLGLPGDIAPDFDETLDLRQWSLAYGFGLSVDYERPIGDDRLDVRLKLSQVFLDTVWSADSRFAQTTSNQTVNLNAIYKYDTGVRLGAYPLLLTGLLGANAFLGDQQDALGFAWFGEYGGGLEVDLEPADAWVKRARVRVTGIAGDGVTGISVGVGVGF